MLTELTVRNLKRFGEAKIELGGTVVFVGPNNSGKTTALQALALWDFGLKQWVAKHGQDDAPERRSGVALNRREVAALPIPEARLLWRDLRVMERNQKVRIEIVVRGVTGIDAWECGLEFEYANEESFHVRPLRTGPGDPPPRMPIPKAAAQQRIVFLPPMSGLATVERRIDAGAIDVSLGEGRSAEVLRNLCHLLKAGDPAGERWKQVQSTVREMFGVDIEDPEYVAARGEIELAYREAKTGTRLDITSAGRGLHQTLLLLTHLHAHPGCTLLLDEPDAHLEFLRQRRIYRVLTDAARATGSQLVAATHSEVLLNEAADRDMVVAFVGAPHRIDDRVSQVYKALKEVGFEHYLQAEERGWILFLEGSTDLAILRTFAQTLQHPAVECLAEPYVHYVGNQPAAAESHFHALREAKPDLVGIAVFDRLERPVRSTDALVERTWSRREIENYLCFPEVLRSYALDLPVDVAAGPLFTDELRARCQQAMERAIARRIPPAVLDDLSEPWWSSVKATDDFLDPLFDDFFRSLELPNLMRKTDYHELARRVPRERIADEIVVVLDQIVAIAKRARPKLRN